MAKPPKPRSAIAGFFFPGPDTFDHRRPYRIFFVCLLVGIVVAVAFGFALYYLNRYHRF
jgi:hypothetical protein